jgi:dihydropteridine reductase
MVNGRVLIYGGRGALGSACVSHFKSRGFWVANVDLHPNDAADVNVAVKPSDDWSAQHQDVVAAVEDALKGGDEKLDAVLCVAGGWAGGNAESKDFVKNCDLMWKQSVWSSAIAASIGAHRLKEGKAVYCTVACYCHLSFRSCGVFISDFLSSSIC